MAVSLKVRSGKQAGQEIQISQKQYLIGGSKDCHLRIGSDKISDHHCVLTIEEPAVVLRDLGSAKGTFVNHRKVSGPRDLVSGDIIAIGALHLEVVISSTSSTLPDGQHDGSAAHHSARG